MRKDQGASTLLVTNRAGLSLDTTAMTNMEEETSLMCPLPVNKETINIAIAHVQILGTPTFKCPSLASLAVQNFTTPC